MSLVRVTNTIVEVHADWNPAAVITQYHVEVALLRGKRLARLRFDPLTGKLCPVCCRVNVAEADLTFAPLQLEAAGSFSTTDVYSAAASLTFAPLQLEAEATHRIDVMRPDESGADNAHSESSHGYASAFLM